MSLLDLAYWAAFAIPLILLFMSGLIRKLVDGVDFKREHWYLGIDLTVFFLASTLVNFLDIAKGQPIKEQGIVWTAVLVASAIVMLLFQAGLHQSWVPKAERSKLQLLILCGFCNFLGILLLYGFVKLKTRGII